jgi:hypothetical protein
LAPITATFDDTEATAAPPQSQSKGMMQTYMRMLLTRLREELSPNSDPSQRKLTDFLHQHAYWIRAESFPTVCKLLKLKPSEWNQYYIRDVRVWIPELEGGKACVPKCPECKQSARVQVNSYPMNHPGRRIISLDTSYYFVARQYKCMACKKWNEEDREEGQGKRQWTFMGTHEECIKTYPRVVRWNFPAILSHRSGLDKSIFR